MANSATIAISLISAACVGTATGAAKAISHSTGSQARTHRQSREEHDVAVDAQAGSDALVIDRGAQAAAKARPCQHVLQRDRQRRADADDEQAVVAHAEGPRTGSDLRAATQPV